MLSGVSLPAGGERPVDMAVCSSSVTWDLAGASWGRGLGEAWVAPRLLGVDAIAFSAGQFADGHLVCRGSAFDTVITGGGQVVVPVRVGGCSGLGCEDVDDVRFGVVREVHRRGDVLPPAFAAAVMQQDHRSALEVSRQPCPRSLGTPRWFPRSSRSCRTPAIHDPGVCAGTG